MKVGDVYYWMNAEVVCCVREFKDNNVLVDFIADAMYPDDTGLIGGNKIISKDSLSTSQYLGNVYEDSKLIATKHKCHCHIHDLMNLGCKCGGI